MQWLIRCLFMHIASSSHLELLTPIDEGASFVIIFVREFGKKYSLERDFNFTF